MCSPMPDLPEHCLIGQTADWIVLPTDPHATWWGCWCALGEDCPEVAQERKQFLPRAEQGA